MPNRMIRESARTSATLSQLSHGAERCFWRLTTVADDFGRFNAEPGVVRALCFPAMLKTVLERHVKAWLAEMRTAGLMRCYQIGDKHVGFFPSWPKYQYVRAKESKFPDPPTSVSVCCDTLANAPVFEVVTTEDEDEDGNGGQRTPPTSAHQIVFKIPAPVGVALDRCPRLGACRRLRRPAWWQAELRANPGVDLEREVYKAETYLVNHPEKHYKRLEVFLHGWLGRADREEET